MYYLAKIAQAAGLTVIGVDFMIHFPKMMNMRILGSGILLFAFGWIIQQYLLKQ